jgi:hypothetical protein
MAFQFPNSSGRKRFDGEIQFEGHDFVYEIFLTPLDEDTPDFNYVVDHIRSRRQKGQRGACLGTTKQIITRHLKKQITSAYGFVRERGTSDEASGSLQVYNWFAVDNQSSAQSAQNPISREQGVAGGRQSPAQVWVNDLCRWTRPIFQSRNTRKSQEKSKVSPVKVLFFLFGQLASHQLQKTELYLNVEPQNEDVLCPIYEKYGFVRDLEHLNDGENIPMKMTIEGDPKYADFPFYLSRRPSSSTRKRKRSSKLI